METRNTSLQRVLWVEGKDDDAVVQSLCKRHRVPEVFQVENKEGIDNIREGLSVEIRSRRLECFGVVVDANGGVPARWASIRDTLLNVGYEDVPEHLAPGGLVLASPPDRPRFGAWLMPDNTSPGMLEDFAALLVPAGDFLWAHAAEVVDGIPDEHRRFTDTHRSKALIHTWLAWQEKPGSPMGQAIGQGNLRADAPDALRLVAWLRRLMVDDAPDRP